MCQLRYQFSSPPPSLSLTQVFRTPLIHVERRIWNWQHPIYSYTISSPVPKKHTYYYSKHMTVRTSKRKQLSNAPLQNKVTPGSWAKTTKNSFLFGFQNRNCVCASCSLPRWHKVFPERKWKFWGKRGDPRRWETDFSGDGISHAKESSTTPVLDMY